MSLKDRKRKKAPQRHDLVIANVHKITKHGVYVDLIEYDGLEGYVHVSEVTGAWVRNIRNFVRQGQQIVAKCTHVNRETGQINLSIKRVSDQLKKVKISEYKKQNSALALIKLISERANMSEIDLRDLLEDKFNVEFGSLYNGFEEVAIVGMEVLKILEIDDTLAKLIHEISEMSIQANTVSIIADLGIRSFAPDGVDQIRKLLLVAEKTVKTFPDVVSNISTIGSPQYRISLEGREVQQLSEAYNEIEKALKIASEDLDLQYKLVQKKR